MARSGSSSRRGRRRKAGARRSRAPVALRVLGAHPRDKKPVELHAGRYGPYVKHGDINATLPDRDKVEFADARRSARAARRERGQAGRECRDGRRAETGCRKGARSRFRGRDDPQGRNGEASSRARRRTKPRSKRQVPGQAPGARPPDAHSVIVPGRASRRARRVAKEPRPGVRRHGSPANEREWRPR